MCHAVNATSARGGIAVFKFGSSVLDGPGGFQAAARQLRVEVEQGRRVVVVVSAMAGATDALLAAVGRLSSRPPDGLVSRLLATGEAASVALMGIALTDAGVLTSTLSPDAVGLRTVGPLLDAEPRHVAVEMLEAALEESAAVVVPGFVGVDASGEPSLLGRGGSDLTALFLARSLGAELCTLVKDTDGVYAADPKVVGDAPRLPWASWDDVLALGGDVVQPKALAWARDRGVTFRVAGTGGVGTLVGAPPRRGEEVS